MMADWIGMLAWAWPVSFGRPAWLWLLAVIPLLVLISRRALTGLEPGRRFTVLALRSLVIATLALALAELEIVRRSDQIAVIFVLDRSRSVPEALRERSEAFVREVARLADSDDRVGVVGVDGEAQVDLIPSRGGVDLIGFGTALQPDRTNLAAGLRMAMASFPEGFARRVVLISDGNENLGRLADEVEIAAANGVVIDVIPLDYAYSSEMLVDRIAVPARAGRNTTVPVRLIARSTEPLKARLRLYHNDVPVPLKDDVVTLVGDMQANRFDIPIELTTAGVHRFSARLTPLDPSDDAIPENNQAVAFTFIEDAGRVLILTRPSSADDLPLAEALRRERIDVDLAGVDELNIDLLKLQEYAAVVLANVPADAFTEGQHKALASYVRDFGGGIIMLGGDESLGAGGWIGKPLEEVSPVAFEIRHRQVIPRGALAIIMHSCEIPRGNYWGEQMALAAVETISSLDYVGVICYSWHKGGPNWDVPMAPAVNKPEIKRRIKAMQIGDMPDFDTSMSMAVEGLLATDAVQRHMIIISDGDPSPPSPATIQTMVANRITCSTVGIGYGAHVIEATMRDIARRTFGKFYACRDPDQLPRISVKEARVVRRGLIDEKPFTPQLVPGISPVLQGFSQAQLPPLEGMVLTQPKPDAVLPLFRQGRDGIDPVLAHWNYETGRMMVFTSGWWNRWGRHWASWDRFGSFWAQAVRWVCRQETSADFDVLTRLEGNRGMLVVEALNRDAGFLDFLRIQGRLLTPGLEQRPLALIQTGPGRYEAGFDVEESGNYLVNLEYRTPDRQTGLIRAGLSVPYSPEFRELGSNVALLREAAARTGGRVLPGMDPKQADVFARNLPPVVSRRPMWRWLIAWVLLPLFILDVAGRRLVSSLAMSLYVEVSVLIVVLAVLRTAHGPYLWHQWSGVGTVITHLLVALLLAELAGWSIRRRYLRPVLEFVTAGVRGLTRTGPQEALGRLRGVREGVRRQIEAGAPPRKPPEEPPAGTLSLEETSRPEVRFEPEQQAGAMPAAELDEALGPDHARQRPAAPPAAGAPPEAGPGDLASRLREAKRRAREKLDERGKERDQE